jgi:hypothetical protein
MIAIAHPWKRVGYIWDNIYPVMVGVALFAAIMVYGPTIFSAIGTDKSSLSTMYTAIAGIFAIITGFLANFYCTIQSLTDTRLRRISRTGVFLRFVSYIKIAIKAGFVVAIASIPYIILTPEITDSSTGRLIVSIWFGACAYALCAFFRIAGMLFFIFERTPPEDEGAG